MGEPAWGAGRDDSEDGRALGNAADQFAVIRHLLWPEIATGITTAPLNLLKHRVRTQLITEMVWPCAATQQKRSSGAPICCIYP